MKPGETKWLSPEMKARYVLAVALLVWAPGDTSAADSLSYPAPPNPFAQRPPEPPSLEPERPVVSSRRRLRPRWQPVVCLGLLSCLGAATKPHEPSLLAAIDAYHGAGAGMASPVALRDCGLACVAHHSELIWLGWLGRWLPFLPMSLPAARELLSAAEADQLLLWALLGGYLLRKLLPTSVGKPLPHTLTHALTHTPTHTLTHTPTPISSVTVAPPRRRAPLQVLPQRAEAGPIVDAGHRLLLPKRAGAHLLWLGLGVGLELGLASPWPPPPSAPVGWGVLARPPGAYPTTAPSPLAEP